MSEKYPLSAEKPTDLDVFKATIGQLKREEEEDGITRHWPEVDPSFLTEADYKIFSQYQTLYRADVGVTTEMVHELEEDFSSYSADIEELAKLDTVDNSAVQSRAKFRDAMANMIMRIRTKHHIYD
jgi:hypothetical protein